MDEICCNSPIATDVLADLEREQLVRDCIEMLPPRCRQMITLLFFEQPPQPYAELAERLGLASGLDRLHSRALFEAAQANPGGQGLLMGSAANPPAAWTR